MHLLCVNFGVKSTHFDRKTTRFDLQNQIPTHFQTISPWGAERSAGTLRGPGGEAPGKLTHFGNKEN